MSILRYAVVASIRKLYWNGQFYLLDRQHPSDLYSGRLWEAHSAFRHGKRFIQVRGVLNSIYKLRSTEVSIHNVVTRLDGELIVFICVSPRRMLPVKEISTLLVDMVTGNRLLALRFSRFQTWRSSLIVVGTIIILQSTTMGFYDCDVVAFEYLVESSCFFGLLDSRSTTKCVITSGWF
jgi:hypothetical protein